VNFVIDANVAGKWLVPEQDTDRARVLFREWNEGRVELVAPALLLAEVANMLWKRTARGLLSAGTAVQLFQAFTQFGLPLAPMEGLADSALELSVRHRYSFYDCLYVALAIERRCDLLTADERLLNAFHPRMPQVKLLRDWKRGS